MIENKEVAVEQLAKLAMEGQLAFEIDWNQLNIQKEDAYRLMATNVIDQLEAVPQDNFAAVAMATITKLLVENFVLNIKLKGTGNAQ
jgi:ligand-binding sensor protein